MLAIGENPERPDLEFFHVDYVQDSADPATRPVTFLVNGGPGGASIFLHIAAIGPLTIATAGDGSFPAVPARLEKNPDSWIDFILDRYDGTQSLENPIPEKPGLNTIDRTVAVPGGVLLPPFMDYVRKDLGYVTERAYIPLNLEVNALWDWTSKSGGPEDLATALTQNQDLKALVVHGMHDLATPYFLSRYVLEQSTITPGARARLFFGVYFGGHMFYLQRASRTEFAADVRKFYEGRN